jgi:tetratricopeptide (TPR) repeat protein
MSPLALTAAAVSFLHAASALPWSAVTTGPEETEVDADEQRAQKLYEEGERAYRLGDFGLAIEKFKAAYEASSRPQLLYNVGLAYKRNYEVTSDVADLRAAKAVLNNYLVEIEKDPEVGDEEEIRELVDEIDRLMQDAGRAEGAAAPAPAPAQTAPDKDPGRSLRIAGVVGLALGAGGIVAGGVLGLALGLVSRNTQDEVDAAWGDHDDMGCTLDDTSQPCTDLRKDIDDKDDYRRLTKNLAIGLGVSLAGVGTIAMIAGGVILARGNKKTEAWKAERKVMLLPAPGGLALVGRF